MKKIIWFAAGLSAGLVAPAAAQDLSGFAPATIVSESAYMVGWKIRNNGGYICHQPLIDSRNRTLICGGW